MVAGMDHSAPSAIFFIVPRRIFPERVFGRRVTAMASLKGGHGTDLLAHQRDELLLDLLRTLVDACLQHDEAAGHLALEAVGHADDRAFRDIGMGGEHLLHAAGREAVAG
jgi:hypothetical protein